MPRNYLPLLPQVALGFLVFGCGGGDPAGPGPNPVVVTVSPGRDTLTVNTSATFSATVAGASNTAVSWSVQEGATAGTVSATGLFTASANPGTRHIIAVSEASSSTKDTAVVLVVAAPVASITAPTDVGTGAAGLAASVEAQSGVTYAWIITGGTITGGAATPAVTFTAGAIGTLDLHCTVTNLAGTSVTGIKSVSVQPIPQIASFAAAKNVVTTGQAASLTAVFVGGTGSVNQGVGSVTSGAPVTTGPVAGSVTYTLSVTSPLGPTVTATASVVGVEPPVVTRFAAVQRAVGSGDPANLLSEFTPPGATGSVNAGIGAVDNGLLRATDPLVSTTTFVLTVRNPADSSVSASRLVLVEPKAPGSFNAAGSTATARYGFTATLLTNGNVLLTGGDTPQGVLDSTLLYNPVAHTFAPTGRMLEARIGHAAVRLANGRVLVTGGPSATAELYDPVAGTFSTTGNMTRPRQGHTMTLLTNGKVLVVGGDGFPVAGGTAELYDPVSGAFASTGPLGVGRTGFQAIGLQDGRVLILLGLNAAGDPLLTAEAYNPGTGTFTSTGSLVSAHRGGTATLIQNGKVLVAGGWNGAATPTTADFGLNPVAELFDPSSNQFTTTGPLAYPRQGHAAVLRLDGTVLIAYGEHTWYSSLPFGVPPSEVYDPTSGAFHPGPSVVEARSWLPAGGIRLASGIVVFFGSGDPATAEQFQ
jgi:hypothetical protein